ncbi:MAG: hypothetical protein C5B56_10140 [Proteobacteria bacterium]|nr:MAG: hypothetical protein C5B56_10140 [Pseudomonadota bacterium]
MAHRGQKAVQNGLILVSWQRIWFAHDWFKRCAQSKVGRNLAGRVLVLAVSGRVSRDGQARQQDQAEGAKSVPDGARRHRSTHLCGACRGRITGRSERDHGIDDVAAATFV